MNIREQMPVINSQGEQIGHVVKANGEYVQIETTAGHVQGHYWVPVALVQNVDEQGGVTLNNSGDELEKRWLSKNPEQFKQDMVDEASEESFPGSDPPSFNPGKS